MTKRFGALAAVAAVCLAGLAGAAAAQEGTGAPVFRLRGDEIRAAYPPAAKAKGLEGEAVVTCRSHGRVVLDCVLTSETPLGEGFGPAALALIKRYEASAAPADEARFFQPQSIRIPFKLPEEKPFHVGGAEYVSPRTLESPSLDALYDAWPRAARFSGVEGSVSLWCTVTVEGRATACTVGKESRPGQGFGQAALGLAPLYRMAPARRNGAPVAMSIPLSITFACDVRCRRFEGARSVPPVLAQVPTPAQVQAAYPAAAKARGLEGMARLDCLTVREGGMTDCRVVAETPAGQGFGAAALTLVDKFSAIAPEPERLSFSVAFDQRSGLVNWSWDDFPGLMASGDPTAKLPGPPPVEGTSRLRCQVAQGGRLEACIVLESTPPDPEVARQVLENLAKVRVRDWTEEGHSTIGTSVELTASAGPRANPRLVDPVAVPPVVAPGVLDYRPMTALSSPLDMSRYFPDRAQRMEVSGRAVLSCAGIKDRHLDNCRVTAESPADYGFGDAALKMARAMRYTPLSLDGAPSDDPIVIPIEFTVPR